MLKIAINGACGKMGQTILNQAKELKQLEITTLIDKTNNCYNENSLKIQTFETVNKELIDIIIDFSTNEGFNNSLDFALKHKIPIVSGTTGLRKETLKKMKDFSKQIAILHSSNMSLGINIVQIVLKQLATMTKNEFEIEIIEKHHSQKQDSPSGTALMLGQTIAKAKKLSFEKIATFQRTGQHLNRDKEEIGFSSIRAGGIAGEHTIIFASQNETIEITHTAFNRKIFANGALKAAIWLKSQKCGFYSMKNVLDSSKL
jgi:4-hydroxy-tetrahydrodipicolinate reductase